MAPYRVNLFNELGKYCDLTVCFEQKVDTSRNENWYLDNIQTFKALYLKKWDYPLKKIKWDILKYLNERKIDIAVSYEYSTPTSALFMLECIRKKIPYFINCDGAFINKHFIKDKIKKFFITHASGCLANGESAKKYFMYYGAKEENIYLHNFSSLFEKDILASPLNEYEKKELKQKLGLESKPTAIAVGRFIYEKGFDSLIKSWSKVNKEYNLLIIGGGEKKQEYEELKNSLSLSNIEIIDFMQKDKLFEYYKACDLFVLPTRGDVWGLVINEAMACGLPIITTDKCIAGLELVKDYENGFLVPVDDLNTLSDRINEVMGNDELRYKMSKESLYKIKGYTIESIAKSHLEAFKEILYGEHK
jgi:glycosyltransferase involved in cell wall biosynthesis